MITLQSVSVWLINAYFAGVIGFLMYRNGWIKKISFITIPFLGFYLSFVAKITVFSRYPTYLPQYILLPFWSYLAIFEGETGLVSEVIWNVVLFIPIGILIMILLTSKHKMLITVICGFVITTAIELIQLIFHRGLFEFDDIFHNTLGSVIGIGIYLLMVKILAVLCRGKKKSLKT